ncbi:MAG: hypothetical protein LBL49_07270 [Clostridiales Family XIII bacterium]|jgi:hypothetical protein|nr:hypothetical protein [Clostridiales Family XIII bacterium]
MTEFRGAMRADAEEKTIEEIALDNRLDQDYRNNERTRRESGVVGTSIRAEVNTPIYDVNEINDQLAAVLFIDGRGLNNTFSNSSLQTSGIQVSRVIDVLSQYAYGFMWFIARNSTWSSMPSPFATRVSMVREGL